MPDKKPRSVAVQLKKIGEALGIKNRVLRYVVDNELVPGLSAASPGHFVAREFTESEAALIALAAVLHDHGFRGAAAAGIIKKAKSQLQEGKSTVCADFRGDFPVQVRITTGPLLRRLRSNSKEV